MYTPTQNSLYWPFLTVTLIFHKVLESYCNQSGPLFSLFICAGVAGTVAAIVWGAIAYKNRGPAMTTSRYLMRLRVIAQSCVVGSIMAGIGVTALQDKLEAKSKDNEWWWNWFRKFYTVERFRDTFNFTLFRNQEKIENCNGRGSSSLCISSMHWS